MELQEFVIVYGNSWKRWKRILAYVGKRYLIWKTERMEKKLARSKEEVPEPSLSPEELLTIIKEKQLARIRRADQDEVY